MLITLYTDILEVNNAKEKKNTLELLPDEFHFKLKLISSLIQK
jgi:hypothetical protein